MPPQRKGESISYKKNLNKHMPHCWPNMVHPMKELWKFENCIRSHFNQFRGIWNSFISLCKNVHHKSRPRSMFIKSGKICGDMWTIICLTLNFQVVLQNPRVLGLVLPPLHQWNSSYLGLFVFCCANVGYVGG